MSDANPNLATVFWLDCLTRGLSNRDTFTRLFPIARLSEDPGSLAWSGAQEFYDRVKQALLSCVTLAQGDREGPAESAVFDARFGWVLESGIGKVHLGNVCCGDDVTLRVGNRSYVSGNARIQGNGTAHIGSFCSMATDMMLVTSNVSHPTQFPTTYNLAGSARLIEDGLGIEVSRFEDYASTQTDRDVRIGHDVWIGREVTIMNGVRVGNGCVIGTKALVTKDCEPFGIYGGVPAKLIRYRFSSEVISELEQIAWWDWDHERIARNTAFFDTDLTAHIDGLNSLVRP